jgi:predicted regulator of Ras-like GTPase activity (Roadblock/LC7/MglB family)
MSVISGSGELTQLLGAMNERGRFTLSLLTDRQGFSIASAAKPEQNPDIKAATVAVVNKMLAQVREHLEMAPTDEIVLQGMDGQRLVCRPFRVEDHEFILAVLAPSKQHHHRQLTNQLIRDVRRIWKSYWV